MNLEQFAAIEARWLSASSGPWTIRDLRDETHKFGIVFTSKQAIERLMDGGGQLETVRLNSLEEAEAVGFSKEQWIGSLEEFANSPNGIESIIDRFRTMVCMPPALVKAGERKVDRLKGGDEPTPSFAVLHDAKKEDVSLVLHAAEDMGTLLSEITKMQDRINDLTTQLKSVRAEADDARDMKSKAMSLVDQFRKVAKSITDLVGEEKV